MPQWITPERWNETVTVPGLGEYTCSIVDTEVYFGPPVYDYQDTCIAFQQDIVRSTCCDFNFWYVWNCLSISENVDTFGVLTELVLDNRQVQYATRIVRW